MYLECDGTGVPVTPRELAGRRGKQEDGTAKTREVKLGCIFTQTGTDQEGKPVRDKDSTSYVGSIEPIELFAKRLEAEAVRRGYWRAEKTVVIGDGARWVWKLADEHFFGSVQIVDFYHASEHLHSILQELYPDKEQLKQEKSCWIHLLEEGKIEELLQNLKARCRDGLLSDKIPKDLNYFEQNIEHMRYAAFKDQNLFIGSGVIEGGCKSIVGKRFKQSGMRWSVKGANAILALRNAIYSVRFDELWEQRNIV